MKIALLGYGKMGQVIEQIALERGHEIVLRKAINDAFEGLENADVAIEFSAPDAAVANISESLNKGIPVVSGTTGWLEEYNKMTRLCEEKNTDRNMERIGAFGNQSALYAILLVGELHPAVSQRRTAMAKQFKCAGSGCSIDHHRVTFEKPCVAVTVPNYLGGWIELGIRGDESTHGS